MFFADGVYIYLQRDFDTVNYSILLEKLDFCRIPGIPKMWFKSFPTGRNQFTNLMEKSSCKLPVTKCLS